LLKYGEITMMRKFGKFLFINFFCVFLILFATSNIAKADPVIEEITLNPKNPAPLSDVTFSVDFIGNSITSAYIVVSECNKEKGICHAPPQNITLTKIDSNTYKNDVTLKWDDVTSITYKVVIKSDGKWIAFEDHTTILSTNSGNSNDSNGSPGFEIMFFLIAMVGILFISKKTKKEL
jgi:hypothetical protein